MHSTKSTRVPVRSFLRGTVRKSLVAAGLMSLCASAHANLIVNGDFESGTLGGFVSSGSVLALSDANYVAGAGATGSFPAGHYIASFGAGDEPATGLISQSFATIVGLRYILTFDYGKYGGGAGAQSITAAVTNVANSAILASLSVTDASGTNALGSVLSAYSQSFIATGLLTTLSFRDTSGSTASTDGLLDNISVSAVPEPGTLALVAVAAAVLAVARRRRNPR